MPSVAVKLYSVFFKLSLKHKLMNSGQQPVKDGYGYGFGSRSFSSSSSSSGKTVPANASFVDGVATKDVNIDPFTSLSLRIFLPQSALPQDQITDPGRTGLFGYIPREDYDGIASGAHSDGKGERGREGRAGDRMQGRGGSRGMETRGNDYGGERRSCGYDGTVMGKGAAGERRRNALGERRGREFKRGLRDGFAKHDGSSDSVEEYNELSNGAFDDKSEHESPSRDVAMENGPDDSEIKRDKKRGSVYYQGYQPATSALAHKKLPIILQFHGGGFVSGGKDSAANDFFCRRMARLCDAIVVAVGYRLAPEHKYPAAFEDGFEALCWLAKQSNLAECSQSLGLVPSVFWHSGSDVHRPDLHRQLVDSFGGSVVEPWLAAHGDPSRCVLLGVSSGGNIADHVARKAVLAGRLLEPVKVVAQVLMYPFFIGSIPTPSEIKLANSYFYDKATCILAWKLFLPDDVYDLDHPAANPLVAGRDLPLKIMPPTLTIVAELDWMKDRAIAYSESLRKVKLDAPVLEYKDTVHEFATLDLLINSREAEASAEDMAIWIKKYISLKGYELSY